MEIMGYVKNVDEAKTSKVVLIMGKDLFWVSKFQRALALCLIGSTINTIFALSSVCGSRLFMRCLGFQPEVGLSFGSLTYCALYIFVLYMSFYLVLHLFLNSMPLFELVFDTCFNCIVGPFYHGMGGIDYLRYRKKTHATITKRDNADIDDYPVSDDDTDPEQDPGSDS